MPGSSIRYLIDQIETIGITIIPIEPTHILRTQTLPHHHGDPFDRMIVAQAIEEDLSILSADMDIRSYAAPVIWK